MAPTYTPARRWFGVERRNLLLLLAVMNRHCYIADMCAFRSFGIPDFIWLFAKIFCYEGFELVASDSC
jgi:hypothetical protein